MAPDYYEYLQAKYAFRAKCLSGEIPKEMIPVYSFDKEKLSEIKSNCEKTYATKHNES